MEKLRACFLKQVGGCCRLEGGLCMWVDCGSLGGSVGGRVVGRPGGGRGRLMVGRAGSWVVCRVGQ